MTIPAKNLAIENRIVVRVTILMMRLPCATTSPFVAFPYKQIVTSSAYMVAVGSCALTSTAFGFETKLNRAIRKSHLTPPWSVRDYIVALIGRMSSYMLSGRIEVRLFYILGITLLGIFAVHQISIDPIIRWILRMNDQPSY